MLDKGEVHCYSRGKRKVVTQPRCDSRSTEDFSIKRVAPKVSHDPEPLPAASFGRAQRSRGRGRGAGAEQVRDAGHVHHRAFFALSHLTASPGRESYGVIHGIRQYEHLEGGGYTP